MPTSTLERPLTGARQYEKYNRLIAVAQALPRLNVAVAHPCDEAALVAALEAAERGIIELITVGSRAKMEATVAAPGRRHQPVPALRARAQPPARRRAPALSPRSFRRTRNG